ncbi:uncharacterized protein A4U43_C05F30520 [Asparagus officinalis]|uniref:Uncharacterized protein n=1 Tax=Asparagus officinalis TaxID=4686 RepID=A0A5P1EVM6_ASPOF|nr:uncharacterized protein A4U43_C05F30520 [Asparagus officinalis]
MASSRALLTSLLISALLLSSNAVDAAASTVAETGFAKGINKPARRSLLATIGEYFQHPATVVPHAEGGARHLQDQTFAREHVGVAAQDATACPPAPRATISSVLVTPV